MAKSRKAVMGKKLLLVNPVNPRRVGLTASLNTRFPPLGLGIVAALTPADWEVELIDENFEPFALREADLVGLTAFTTAAPRAYEIARLYRERGIPTVLGGIHASMLPEEAQQYVDTVVIGEAEGVWPKVVADFEAGRLQRTYRAERIDLKDMPKARHDLFHPDYVFASVQTARGCPMDCEFCSVTAFNGHRYRQRPVENVLDELEAVPQKVLFFVDDNIFGYGPHAAERASSLFQGMLDRGIKKDWLCQASLNFADNEEVLELAGRAGCRLVFVGLEAADGAALGEVNKQLNLRRGVPSYAETLRRFHRHGIAVLGGFIYGMDSDVPETLRRRTDYILRAGVDAFQITVLTALPGTRLFERLYQEGRLLYSDFPRDWEHYDMVEVTHRPRSMAAEELTVAGRQSGQRVYSRRAIWRKFARTWCATRSLTTALWAYHTNMGYRAIMVGWHGRPPKTARAGETCREKGQEPSSLAPAVAFALSTFGRGGAGGQQAKGGETSSG
jgi:radical SAM superfamily enzyme YgiQ (UPF0313 family)